MADTFPWQQGVFNPILPGLSNPDAGTGGGGGGVFYPS